MGILTKRKQSMSFKLRQQNSLNESLLNCVGCFEFHFRKQEAWLFFTIFIQVMPSHCVLLLLLVVVVAVAVAVVDLYFYVHFF